MNDYIKNISQRLKIVRVASGYLSAKEFTDKFKIPPSTYNQHENGKRTLSLENIFFYCEIFHIEPAWFILGLGNPCPDDENYTELEKKILLEQHRLCSIGKIDAVSTPVINSYKKYSLVDVKIIKKILNYILPMLHIIPKSKKDEVIDFCFDLYNKITTSDINDIEQEYIIKIGLESFFKGLGIESDQNTAPSTYLNCRSLDLI